MFCFVCGLEFVCGFGGLLGFGFGLGFVGLGFFVWFCFFGVFFRGSVVLGFCLVGWFLNWVCLGLVLFVCLFFKTG